MAPWRTGGLGEYGGCGFIRMSDIFDAASDREQLDRDLALKVRKPTLVPCHRCHYCDESVSGNLLFCCPDCRDDFEILQEAKRRNGSWAQI